MSAAPDESRMKAKEVSMGAKWVKKFEVEGAKVTQEGTKVTITFDLATDIGASNSGESLLVVTSRGNQKVKAGDEVVYFNMNCYKFVNEPREVVNYRDIDGSR